MEIETTVKVKNTSERCNLYTLFVHAAQGDFKGDIDSGDKAKIKNIEDTIKAEFDVFANQYFNLGRNHEKESK